MKKFVSLVLSVVILATMLCVFAIPAFAEDAPKEFSPEDFLPTTMFNKGSYIIKEAGEYEVETLFVCPSTRLIIGEGVTIKMTHAFIINKGGTIEVLGTLDISQGAVAGRERIIVGDTGELIDPRGPEDTKGQIAEGETESAQDPHKRSSVLSEGSLTIIVGVACLAVGFLVAMFIFKKKKKPALASGAESADEE